MKNLDRLAFILVVLGALNWGMVGVFNVNPIEYILSNYQGVVRVIYTLVAAAALYEIFGYRAIHHRWYLRHPAG